MRHAETDNTYKTYKTRIRQTRRFRTTQAATSRPAHGNTHAYHIRVSYMGSRNTRIMSTVVASSAMMRLTSKA